MNILKIILSFFKKLNSKNKIDIDIQLNDIPNNTEFPDYRKLSIKIHNQS